MIERLLFFSFVFALLLCNSCRVLQENRVNKKLKIHALSDQDKFVIIDKVWLPEGENSYVIEFKLREKTKGIFSIYRYSYCYPEQNKYRESLAYVSEFKGDTIVLYDVDRLKTKRYEKSYYPIQVVLTDAKSMWFQLSRTNFRKAYLVDSIMGEQIKKKCAE